jgi:hypothetical protein
LIAEIVGHEDELGFSRFSPDHPSYFIEKVFIASMNSFNFDDSEILY